ncbi:MAG: cell division protein FtsQ/DivIB [Planctomycetota bacterium]|jgi:hypothetical protein
MAKRKHKKRRLSIKSRTFKDKKKRMTNLHLHLHLPFLTVLWKVSAVLCLFAAIVIAFMFLEKYVNKTIPISEKSGLLELVGSPPWVNNKLKRKIFDAALADGEDLKLDEDGAWSVQQNIESIAWLDNVRVQTTNDRFRIYAEWRTPLAMIKFGLQKFYVDKNFVVMDFVPVQELPIIEVKGLSAYNWPPIGQACSFDDLAAAVIILEKLNLMDKRLTPDRPLLYEIGRIDVSNFNGRRDNRSPHIILYTTDNTEIIWGAEFGSWQRYMESKDEEKLAKLYAHYTQHGSLLGGVKYIRLCDPQDKIFQPIDKY